MIRRIDNSLLDNLCQEAEENRRKRKHLNFHSSYEEPVQRLLNAIEPGSYIRPHMHKDPDKIEIFIALKGRFMVFIFDDHGTVTDRIELVPAGEVMGLELAPGTWHTIAALEKGSVAYEVKNGPYVETTDKNFAKWAPEEGTEEGTEYLNYLLNSV
jgi:cupin fold WbuC family metalloprotein